MKLFKKICVFSLLVFMVSCSSTFDTRVDAYKNDEVDTSNYKTFAWLNESKILIESDNLNPVMKLKVDDEIENAFIKKGYRLINDPESADFTISYTVGSRDKITVNSYPSSYSSMGWGRGYYGGYHRSFSYGTETRVTTYTEGKLAIDIFDVKTHQPAWHGVGVKKITSDERDEPGEVINLIVNQVIGQFK